MAKPAKESNLGWLARTDENRELCQKGAIEQEIRNNYRKGVRLLNGNGMIVSWCSAVSLRRSTTPDCSGFGGPIWNVSCLDENLWDIAGRYLENPNKGGRGGTGNGTREFRGGSLVTVIASKGRVGEEAIYFRVVGCTLARLCGSISS